MVPGAVIALSASKFWAESQREEGYTNPLATEFETQPLKAADNTPTLGSRQYAFYEKSIPQNCPSA